MTSVFRNILSASIGSTPTTVLTTSASATTTVIGMSLTNTTPEQVLVSIQLSDPNGLGEGYPTSAYYISNVPIPGNTSLRVINGGEKLIMQASTDFTITSSVDNSVDLVMSWVEIS
jgi:hypothetical protein